MMSHLSLVLLTCLVVAFSTAFGQPLSDPRLANVPTNLSADALYFADRSTINTFLYPPATVTSDAAYVVRYVLVQLIAAYDISASCFSPIALSFLGTRLTPPQSVCSRAAHSTLVLTHALLSRNFPPEAASLRHVLEHTNLLRTLPTRANTWVTQHAERLNAFLLTDGWNAPTYTDPRPPSRAYSPRNAPGVSPRNLSFPLRWQPSTTYVGRGRSSSQVHVFPHLSSVAPLVLSRAQFSAPWRRARSPYKWRNSRGRIGRVDLQFVTDATRQVMNASNRASQADVARAAWWDSKLASTGVMNLHYAKALNLRPPAAFAFLLGDMLAQHDAVVLAFREKVAHDLARPQPIIRALIDDAFTSRLQAQPHAEFPSASAMLCAASLDHAAIYAREETGTQLPMFRGTTAKSVFLPNSERAVDVMFNTPFQAAKKCAESRVQAGVHFQASVDEGRRIARGIGNAAYEHMRQLFAGQVPEGCERCGKF